jgi:hypothetical protein
MITIPRCSQSVTVLVGFMVCGLSAATGAPAWGQVPAQFIQPPPFRWLEFGQNIAASPDTLVTGAPDSIRNDDTSDCNVALSGFGAAGVYAMSGSQWSISQELWHDFYPAMDTLDHEPRFGASVSLHGNTLAVTAERLQDGSTEEVGAFYLFQRSSPSENFSRSGPFYPPSPIFGERLGEIGGLATNGSYVAIDLNSTAILIYSVQGSQASFLEAVSLPVSAPPFRIFITDTNIMVAMIPGYQNLVAYQLSPTGATAVDTSMLSDGWIYAFPAAGDGNTFVAGLSSDVTKFRIVRFGSGTVSAVSTLVAPVPFGLPNPPTPNSPQPRSLAIKEGEGIYIVYLDATPADAYIAGFLSGSYTMASVIQLATMSGVGITSSGGISTAFNGAALFVGDPGVARGGGNCTNNYPSAGAVYAFWAGGLGAAIVETALTPLM